MGRTMSRVKAVTMEHVMVVGVVVVGEVAADAAPSAATVNVVLEERSTQHIGSSVLEYLLVKFI